MTEILPRLTRQSRTFATRLQSYDDRREDFEAWRNLSELALEVDKKSLTAANVYGEMALRLEVEGLWAEWRERCAVQPEKILGMHQEAHAQIQACSTQLTKWLATRREDFENRQQAYQTLLGELGYKAELRVPFDQEHPSESRNALTQNVLAKLDQYFQTMLGRLKAEQEIVRYANLVQQLPLGDLEGRILQAIACLADIKTQISPEVVDNLELLRKSVIVPVRRLEDIERDINRESGQAIKQRAATGSEATLLQQIMAFSQDQQQTDLRSLILQLLGKGTKVELDVLMKDLQALFQKNQISIYVNVRKSSGSEGQGQSN